MVVGLERTAGREQLDAGDRLAGIGEGLITAGALTFIYASRRDLLKTDSSQSTGNNIILVGGLLIALILAILSPLASANPDGLEKVAEQQGFINFAQSPLVEIIPDYVIPGISDQNIATILAGIVGVVIVFLLVFLYASWKKKSLQYK